jgi:hypothetical protein
LGYTLDTEESFPAVLLELVAPEVLAVVAVVEVV